MLCGTPGVSLNLSNLELAVVAGFIILALIIRMIIKNRRNRSEQLHEQEQAGRSDEFSDDVDIDA